jgi:outer membrane receptor protein involved in Fe transport
MVEYFKKHFFVILTLLFCVGSVGYSQTGILKGHISDKVTKDGLPSVNVVVKGTYYGAATDFDGNFTIQKMNAGTYVVEVKLIGYKLIQYPAVKIVNGETTVLDIAMEETSLSLGQEVVIVGEKPMFNIEETSSKRSVKSEDMSVAAVQNVQDVVAMQVGVVKSDDQIHIRGGRSYETAYIIDGISVQDPMGGTGFGSQLPPGSIQEAEVITGGYNAEYGQATSGVVNLTTKDGGDKYSGSLGHKQDHFGLNDDSRSNFNTDIYDFMLSGPEPLTTYILPALGVKIPGSISFFANGNVNLTDGYTRWVETTKNDTVVTGWEVKAPGGLKSGIVDQSWLSPRRSNNWSGFGKLTWKITPTIKVAYAATYSLAVNQNSQSIQTTLEYQEPQPGYQYLFQNIPDSANTFAQVNMQQSLILTHTLNTKTFYELRLSKYTAHLRADANGKSWQGYTEPKDIITLPVDFYKYIKGISDTVTVIPGDGFYDVGSPFTWRDQYVNEYTIKFDLTSNFDEKNKFKSGIEMRFQDMQMIDIYEPWVKPLGYDNDIYAVKPALGAIYAQDNLTYGGMILNVGLRFDYWFPGKYVDDAMHNDSLSMVSPTIRQKYFDDTYSMFGLRWKGRLSPRLAIAHPVSDNQTLFFSYGHYSKFPRPDYVYTKLLKSSSRSSTKVIGNPDLNPETTVAYELGIRNQLTENDVLNITAYYKDIFDYITAATMQVQATRYTSGTYTTYVNLDYARTRGVELEYKKRYSDWFRGAVSASYSIGTGKSSSAEEALYNIQQGQSENLKESYLAWDRPFEGTVVLNFRVNKNKALFNFGNGILDDYNIYTRFFYQSGKRYTPQIFISYDATTGRPIYSSDANNPYGMVGEDIMTLDLNIEKYIDLAFAKLVLSIEISNLLNRENAQIINPITGSAYTPTQSNGSRTPTPNSLNDPYYPDLQAPVDPYPYNPARYMAPRHIILGVALKF